MPHKSASNPSVNDATHTLSNQPPTPPELHAPSADTAAANGLINCLVCQHLSHATPSINSTQGLNDSQQRCSRCDSALSSRTQNSVQTTLGLLITSMLLYIPANLYPIMRTQLLGETQDSTIIGGIILFIQHQSYFVAAVIFVASVMVPLAKMFALAWLCYSATRPTHIRQYELTRLYRITEFIGKWSMVDIFVVAILVALIQMGGIMSVTAGFAASAFAAVVMLTMISAHQFDTRILWDKLEPE